MNTILGKQRVFTVLQNHWSTFYTENDIKEIADHGFNLVRIPIEYWAFMMMDDDLFTQGREVYLDQALEWCKDNGLRVQIDIHGMPGSQNGFDGLEKRSSTADWLDSQKTIDYLIVLLITFLISMVITPLCLVLR